MAKTSTIISSTIDETFPVAGQDNDSQGFRDNFNIIKDNFTYAKSDFDDLFGKVLLKAPLNGDSDPLSNAMNNETISSVNLLTHTETLYDGTGGADLEDTPLTINFSAGHHFAISIETPGTITFAGWPDTAQYAEMRLQLNSKTSDPHAVVLNSTYASGANSKVHTDDSGEFTGSNTDTITCDTATTTSKLIKAFTFDGGENVYFEYMGTFVRRKP
jgi:hypothetical protein